jgi:hypothetical protein
VLRAVGSNAEMRTDVRMASQAGKDCEQLIDELERLYTRGSAGEKAKAHLAVNALRRAAGESLLSAVTKTKKTLGEAALIGYDPDNQTLQGVVNAISFKDEILHAVRAAKLKDGTAMPEPAELLDALYEQGIMVEGLTSGETKQGGRAVHEFSGAGAARPPRRKGYIGSGAPKPTGKGAGCMRCGGSHDRGATCWAADKICDNCGVKGHIRRVCKKKRAQQQPSTSSVSNSTGEAYVATLAESQLSGF